MGLSRPIALVVLLVIIGIGVAPTVTVADDCGDHTQEDIGEFDYGTDDPGVGTDWERNCGNDDYTETNHPTAMTVGDGVSFDIESCDAEGTHTVVTPTDTRHMSQAELFQNSKLPGSSVYAILHASQAVDVADKEERMEDDGDVDFYEMSHDDDKDY